VISDEGTPRDDAFGQALERAHEAVRDHDSPEARRDLGEPCFIDDRFAASQQQSEIAFRMFRENGQSRDAARTAINLAGLHGSGRRRRGRKRHDQPLAMPCRRSPNRP
jgi:hypothetical protein